MLIREINKNDIPEILNMMKEFYNSSAVSHPVAADNFELTVNEALSSSPYIDIFIVNYNDKTAGYFQTSITWSNEAGGLVVWIEEIFIKEKFRSMGIGSNILSFIENHYKNAARFRLETEPENTGASRLYLRKGFDYLKYDQMYKGDNK